MCSLPSKQSIDSYIMLPGNAFHKSTAPFPNQQLPRFLLNINSSNFSPLFRVLFLYACVVLQVLMFLGVSVSHIAQLGMTLTWPNVLASDFQHDNTTIYGSSLHLQDWQMDMMGEWDAMVHQSPSFPCRVKLLNGINDLP